MMVDAARDLEASLALLKRLRAAPAQAPARLRELKAWQSKRLAQTYADLATEPRYRKATAFFLEDLYGPKDFSARDEEMIRIVPTMAKVLPASAVETAALAIELEALSEDLDHRLAGALPAGPLDEAAYAKAYRETSTRPERERQIELIDEVGRRLDSLVRKPLVFRTLKLMRTPARMAGLQDLQDFLERGFEAFRAMDGAEGFLERIRSRVAAILNRLFSGAARPFSP